MKLSLAAWSAQNVHGQLRPIRGLASRPDQLLFLVRAKMGLGEITPCLYLHFGQLGEISRASAARCTSQLGWWLHDSYSYIAYTKRILLSIKVCWEKKIHICHLLQCHSILNFWIRLQKKLEIVWSKLRKMMSVFKSCRYLSLTKLCLPTFFMFSWSTTLQ